MTRLPTDYVLVTERMRLRMPDESDLPHVFEASRAPGFCDGMLWDPPVEIEELRGPLARSREAWANGTGYQFTMEIDGTLVGRIALRETDTLSVLDIGYWTHPKHQRQGYMAEAVSAIVRLGFETMGADAIVAEYATWNEPSRRLLERLGFRLAKVVPGGFVKHDRVSDDAWVRLDRADYLAS